MISMADNLIALFLMFFAVIFVVVGLLDTFGFWNASEAAALSGSTTQLAQTWMTELYSMVGDVIGDAFISLVGSIALTIFTTALDNR
jgi:hypothetical protein